MWTTASGGYDVALVDGKVVCRNAAGKTLRSVPAPLKDDSAVVGLRQLAEWLRRHEALCQTEVETWMIRSLPVPLAALTQLWADVSWQRALRDLVVRPYGSLVEDVGLLREIDPARGIGVVTLDGDTVWFKPSSISVPHPVLLDDVEELRAFVVDLGVEQVVPQLFRETYVRPETADLTAKSVDDWARGKFQQLRHLTGRVTSLGYTLRGGYAAVKIIDSSRPLEARLWVGVDAPDVEAETGELVWVDEQGRPLPLGKVGPVAWSEGARMAARVFAGRFVDDEAAA